jgi:hypothetical protein
MSSPAPISSPPPTGSSRWRQAPVALMVLGGLGVLVGGWLDLTQLAYSWLTGFMFFLSVSLGALFLVLMHHLFDAGWSVPLRRFCEHLAALLFPWLAVLFLPVAALAPRLYAWMGKPGTADHPALQARWPLFTPAGFYLASAFCFLAWGVVAHNLRRASLEQDRTGAVACTYRMRRWSGAGIVLFALTLTLAAQLWMQGLMCEWFSTIYGVYYFAGSVWVALGVVYLITLILKQSGILEPVLHEHQFYFLGSLMLAFTVFYAYIHFSQYFVIWNGNLPEETFWYVRRERGAWRAVGLILIFGHFLLPFLALLRIDLKLSFRWMAPLCVWIGLMHYVDLAFNIMPVLHPEGYAFRWCWLDAACLALMGGVLARAFGAAFRRHAPYPVRDPRLREAMGHPAFCPSPLSGGELDEADALADAPPEEEESVR